MKIRKKILEKLEFERKSITRFCNMNNSHNEVSSGKLQLINEMTLFINNIKK